MRLPCPLAALLACCAVQAGAAVLDDFRDTSPWRASASDQVQAALRQDADGSLCLDADFNGVSGYAVMRRELPLAWPAQFDLAVRLKGGGAVNDVQIKWADASGDNVWWVHRPEMRLPPAQQTLTLHRRHIAFAWGPGADRTLRQTQTIEFVIAAGREGGKSTLCVAGLTLAERAADPAQWPAPQQQRGPQTLTLDFGLKREFNGVALRWPARQRAPLDYTLLASDDGRRWRTLRRVQGSDGGLDALLLPDTEARWLRVQRRRAGPLPALELRSAAQWPGANAVLASLAAGLPRGQMPRAFSGEQNYWTLVGVDGGGQRSALMSEDGALELGRGGPSVEPAVRLDDGRSITWADVVPAQQLRDGQLPLPLVQWKHADFTLAIEAAADGPAQAPQLLARYTLRNTGVRTRRFTLLLALRPWQVNPPQQFLSTPGGASAVAALRWDAGGLRIDGRPALLPTVAPTRISALPFDGGLALDGLRNAAALTAHKPLQDPQALASALLQFEITLPPGVAQTLGWTAALAADGEAGTAGSGASRRAARATAPGSTAAALDARFDAATAAWRERLSRSTVQVGAGAEAITDTLRTALAHMLLSRDGPALRPGTRSYARTWVRDGAMMVAALLRLGEHGVARQFVDWYGARIFASGKVPCCVDARGADPVAENDSHGQYLYAVAEVWRHTRDSVWLAGHWPQVQRVTAYQEGLRQSQRGAAQPAHLFGLLPPSISHEGYSDKPAFSYWDDFWALRGSKDAVVVAQALGHGAEARLWAGWRDEFQRELLASINAAAAFHRVQFIPGAADRGDFDPTSTTMALDPAQADVPPPLLAATFERYWAEALARAEGRRNWADYTPYELRNVGALLRLGQPERSHALLRFFFTHQRPPGWKQWAEVVLPDARTPRFLGDMPHAWVSSDYIRSALDLFAYEREADDTLVIGAGWLPAWLQQPLSVRGLSTHHGMLQLALLPVPGGWTLQLLAPLRGRAVLVWPGSGPLPQARQAREATEPGQGGRLLAWQGRELELPAAPATVLLSNTAP